MFCKIVAGAIPADIVFRDERALAFRDQHPQAPVHLLVIPTAHAGGLAEFAAQHAGADLGHLCAVAASLGTVHGGAGYRVVINEGADGGQSVFHVHLHVLAGRLLSWPPG